MRTVLFTSVLLVSMGLSPGCSGGGAGGALDAVVTQDAAPDGGTDRGASDNAPDVLDSVTGSDHADRPDAGRDDSASDGGRRDEGAPSDGRAVDGASDAAVDAPPPCDCTEGACCDGCRYRPTGTTCDPAGRIEHACPWGVRCGSDAGVRQTPRLCSGESAACDGPLGEEGAWVVAEPCEAPSGCVEGACAPTATCEGATCPQTLCPVIDDASGTCNEATGHCEYRFSPTTGVWVLLTPGTFEMGQAEGEIPPPPTEYPFTRHTVTLTRPFLLRATELTQGEWYALTGNRPFMSNAEGEGFPAESLSWWDAVGWCNALSRAEGLGECYPEANCTGELGVHPPWEPCLEKPPWCVFPYNFRCDAPPSLDPECSGYRLPTEAEWEYACRAGSPTELYTGGTWQGDDCDAPEIAEIAWFSANSFYPPYDALNLCHEWCVPPEDRYLGLPCGPSPVAMKPSNPWGLYDMLGNVWEIVTDRYGRYETTPQIDPVAPAGPVGSYHVPGYGYLPSEMSHVTAGRGGAYAGSAGGARCTYRAGLGVLWQNNGYFGGFRPARTVP